MKEDGSWRPAQLLMRLGFTVYLFLIADITLSRSGGREIPLPLTCVTCTDLWLLDIVLNVVLFVPLGLFLRCLRRSWRTGVAIGFLASLMIESFQYLLPALGRDPILGDLIANTMGTALGASARSWWGWWGGQGPKRARAAVAAAWMLGGVTTGWWLVQPAYPDDADWYGQAAARLGHFDILPGTLLEGTVNGIPVPFREASTSVLGSGDALRAEASVEWHGRSNSTAPAVSVFDGRRREVLLLGVNREQAVLRTRTVASTIGLRAPLLAVPFLADSGTVAGLHGAVTSSGWCLIAGSDASPTCWRRSPGLALTAFFPLIGSVGRTPWVLHGIWWGGCVAPALLLAGAALRERRVPMA